MLWNWQVNMNFSGAPTIPGAPVAVGSGVVLSAAGGGPWERLRACVLATVRFGLERPGHYKMLYEG